ncbi:helix-turn-helix domain-containing protein [Vibrio sp. La 4.2.2]|uniref:helix-turn-helix domain-containing protein n=1 Tax=Vibrio sp. La 4.2.2 TaxID=2998830 RepID=UPI0022CDF2B7|nr:helix-turn-helix domain-containing protein [Vibrio sp. La 4.2.2]MDA0109031.1 helix-turn-helix domain-containing protein [Vibrio sp. La 4.2.2]
MKNQRLKQARKAAGFSRNQVAKFMHKSPHTIKSWETTTRQPRTLREVERLCDYLEITVAWYLAGQPPMRPILPTEKERELLALFSELTDEQKEAMLEIMRVML